MLTYRELLNEAKKRLEAAGVENAAYDASAMLMEAFGMDRVHLLLEQDVKNPALWMPEQGTSENHAKEADEASSSEMPTCLPPAQCCRNAAEKLSARDMAADTDTAADADAAGRANKNCARFWDMVSRREARVPLQQILGRAWFCGLEFLVNEHVLTPRQDTEVLVEQVLADMTERDAVLLDMCTGSGCIALSLAVLGKYRQVWGADVSADALRTARENAARLGFEKDDARVRLVQSDLFSAFQKMNGTAGAVLSAKQHQACVKAAPENPTQTAEANQGILLFDAIVSNPPYIRSAVVDTLAPEVRVHEPRLALDGHADGLYFYRRIGAEAGAFLKPGGRLYFEIGYDQGEAVSALLSDEGYADVRVIKDLAGLDRVVRARKS